MFGDKQHRSSWVACPSCHPANSVKTLKETPTLTPTSGPVSSFLHLPSLPSDSWRKEGAWFSSCRFSNDSIM